MIATHTNYQHAGHLRVEDGIKRKAWSAAVGWYETDALCVAPSHSRHSAMNRKGLPCYVCADAKSCDICKRKA